MCLYIDDYDADGEFLGSGKRTARKEHRCLECRRTIEPGETYRYWTWAMDGTVDTSKMCGHCQAVLDLGHAITGCPKHWNATLLYDRDPELGFIANCLHDDDHDLTDDERAQLEALFEGGACGWRDTEGALLPLPAVPAPA